MNKWMHLDLTETQFNEILALGQDAFQQWFNCVSEKEPERIKAHVFVCVLSLLLSRIIERRLSVPRLTVQRAEEILWGIKAIPVKLPMRLAYGSESNEAVRILNEMEIKPQGRILAGALPESG